MSATDSFAALLDQLKTAERFGAKPTGRREVPPQAAPAAWQLAVDRDPSPDEATVLAEAVEELFRGLDDPDERAVLEFHLQGHTAK